MAFRFWYNNNKISYDVCCLLVSPKCSVILKDNQDVCCLQNIIKMFIKCNVTEILIVRSQMSAAYKTFARTRSLLNVLLVLDHLLVDLVRSTEGTPQPYWNKLWNRWLCLAKCSHDHHVKNNSKTTVQTMMTLLDNVLDYGGPLMALLIFYDGRGPTIVATGALEFQRRSLLLQILVRPSCCDGWRWTHTTNGETTWMGDESARPAVQAAGCRHHKKSAEQMNGPVIWSVSLWSPRGREIILTATTSPTFQHRLLPGVRVESQHVLICNDLQHVGGTRVVCTCWRLGWDRRVADRWRVRAGGSNEWSAVDTWCHRHPNAVTSSGNAVCLSVPPCLPAFLCHPLFQPRAPASGHVHTVMERERESVGMTLVFNINTLMLLSKLQSILEVCFRCL